MLNKLNTEQLSRLEDACNVIDYIFVEEENGFDDVSIDEYYSSKLYKGISDIMYQLGKWC